MKLIERIKQNKTKKTNKESVKTRLKKAAIGAAAVTTFASSIFGFSACAKEPDKQAVEPENNKVIEEVTNENEMAEVIERVDAISERVNSLFTLVEANKTTNKEDLRALENQINLLSTSLSLITSKLKDLDTNDENFELKFNELKASLIEQVDKVLDLQELINQSSSTDENGEEIENNNQIAESFDLIKKEEIKLSIQIAYNELSKNYSSYNGRFSGKYVTGIAKGKAITGEYDDKKYYVENDLVFSEDTIKKIGNETEIAELFPIQTIINGDPISKDGDKIVIADEDEDGNYYINIENDKISEVSSDIQGNEFIVKIRDISEEEALTQIDEFKNSIGSYIAYNKIKNATEKIKDYEYLKVDAESDNGQRFDVGICSHDKAVLKSTKNGYLEYSLHTNDNNGMTLVDGEIKNGETYEYYTYTQDYDTNYDFIEDTAGDLFASIIPAYYDDVSNYHVSYDSKDNRATVEYDNNDAGYKHELYFNENDEIETYKFAYTGKSAYNDKTSKYAYNISETNKEEFDELYDEARTNLNEIKEQYEIQQQNNNEDLTID